MDVIEAMLAQQGRQSQTTRRSSDERDCRTVLALQDQDALAAAVAEVEDFVEFLAAKSNKHAALDRLLAIAPALEAAGVEPMSEDGIAAEIKAARAERRARAQGQAKDPGADRS